MKRRFVKFLMMAVVTASMGSFVSCKDTSEDYRTENTIEFKRASEVLEAEIAALRERIAVLEQLNACTCDKSKVEQLIVDLNKEIQDRKDGDDALDGRVDDLETWKAVMEAWKVNIIDQNAVKLLITNAINDLKATLKQCECDPTIPGRLAAVEAGLVTANNTIAQVKTTAENAKAAAEAAKAAAEAAKTSAEAAAATATAAAESAKAVAESAKAVAETAKTIAESNKTLVETIKNYETRMTNIEEHMLVIDENLIVMKDTITNMYMRTYRDSIIVKELEKEMVVMHDSVKILNTRIDSLIQNKVNLMSDSLKTVTDDLKEFKIASEKADKLLQDSIDAVAKDLADLAKQVAANTKAIQDLQKTLKELSEAIARQITGIEIQKVANPWFGSFSTPFDISSNVLVAFYGEAKDPVYFPSTAAYGPYATTKTSNPGLTDADMAMIVACNPELEVVDGKPYVKAGRALMSSADNKVSNAGRVYVTVNPNGLNCNGLQLDLVTTSHATSGMTLSPLAESAENLQFGITRAAGLYKSLVTLEAANIDNASHLNIDTDALKNTGRTIKEVVSEIIKTRTLAGGTSDVVSVVNDMRELVESMRTNRYLLRAPWTDAQGKQNFTSSRADIAALAVQPLSYETFKDFNYVTLPGYEKVYNFIDKMADKITGKVKNGITGLDIFKGLEDLQSKGAAITIKHIDPIDYVSGKSINVAIKMCIFDDKSALTFDAATGVISGPAGFSLTIDGYNPADGIERKGDYIFFTVHKSENISDMYNDIIDDINGAVSSVDKQVTTITDFLDSANKVLDQVFDLRDKAVDSIDNLSDKAMSAIQKILSKSNDIVVGQINALNNRLQPVLLFSVESFSGIPSNSRFAPTSVKTGRLDLIPTSYTLEMIAPASKKHVAVTNVFKGAANAQAGDASCVAVLKAANAGTNMNQRLDGGTHVAAIDMQKGYIYEVAYSSLDYHGKIVTRKYYFEAK